MVLTIMWDGKGLYRRTQLYTLERETMKPQFDWQDPLHLADALTDDERAIAEAAHTFCQERLQTRVLAAARHETFDREIMNEFGEMGFWVAPSRATVAQA